MRQGLANLRARRTPLVPKEMIVPVCQRLALILFVMCSTALGLRLLALYRLGKLGHSSDSSRMLTTVNGTHFFLDIGYGDSDFSAKFSTKKLEDSGWRGVCATPFPSEHRACQPISMPVVPTDGEMVSVDDCSKLSKLQVLVSAITTITCPQVSRAGVGIGELLNLAKAPNVIDFVNIDTRGTELSILNRFPTDGYCMRAARISHSHANEAEQAEMRKLLEARNCAVKGAGDSFWVRCRCGSTQSAASLAAIAPARKARRRHVTPARRHQHKAPDTIKVDHAAKVQQAAKAESLAENSFYVAAGLGGPLMRQHA